jgi:hypothetical protein
MRGHFAALAIMALGLCPSCSSPKFEGLPDPEGIKTKLERNYVKILENAETLEVLSLSPDEVAGKNDREVYGYKLLGQIGVKDKGARRNLLSVIYQSVNEGTTSDWCFEPRHVVRASAAGKSIDLLICFACDSMHVHEDNEEGYLHYPISKRAKEMINRILTDAGIPIAS